MKPTLLEELPSCFDFEKTSKTPIGLRPVGLWKSTMPERHQLPFLGGPQGFRRLEIFLKIGKQLTVVEADQEVASRWADTMGGGAIFRSALSMLTRKRRSFVGLNVNKPNIMGVINVTPDSFYARSRSEPNKAVDTACRMIDDGADIIDIGGESSRPGSNPIPQEQEMDRVLPVLEKLKGCPVPISIDTRRSTVMREAISAGASILNDVTALSDEESLSVLRENPHVSVVLMHAQGVPRSMQNNPQYNHVTYEVLCFLLKRVLKCKDAGIDASRIAIDPGFGFGKTLEQNVQILRELALLHCIGCNVLVGVSRKSFLGAITNETEAEGRLSASIAASINALSKGAQIHRVHDVKQIKQAFAVHDSVTAD